MNKTVKIVLAILAVLAIAAGYFLYKDMYEETLVCTSEHEGYEVRIYMVGSPDFPFGNTSCRIKLYSGGSKLREKDIVLLNDGKTATEENFTVSWQKEKVVITSHGEEMEDYDTEFALKGD